MVHEDCTTGCYLDITQFTGNYHVVVVKLGSRGSATATLVSTPAKAQIPPTSSPTPSSTPAPPTPSATNPPQAPGTSPDAPGISVSASNLHVDSNGEWAPSPGDQYVVVRIAITNSGSQAYEYNELYFYLQDAGDNIRHDGDASDSNIINTELNSGSLPPGQTVAGDVAFEVPQNESRFTLLWEPGLLSNAVTVPMS